MLLLSLLHSKKGLRGPPLRVTGPTTARDPAPTITPQPRNPSLSIHHLLLCSGKSKEGTTCSSTANPLKPRVHSLFAFLLVEE